MSYGSTPWGTGTAATKAGVRKYLDAQAGNWKRRLRAALAQDMKGTQSGQCVRQQVGGGVDQH